jgi:hypothetical protein
MPDSERENNMNYYKRFARPISGWLSAALLFILLAVMLPATPMQAQTPDLTGSPISTGLPAAVMVTDQWSEGPTDRAWVSGDEVLTGPWTLVTASAAWKGRSGHSSVVMPDGSILLMGGFYWSNADGSNNMNDVWRSTDGGKGWTQMAAPAAWSARSGHSSVVLPDGSIVLMGGFDSGYRNDVWVSVDGGASWAPLPNPPWSARHCHTSVVLPNGHILLMGGGDDAGYKNDVWRSVDGGASWTQLPAAPWSARLGHTSLALPNEHILLMGGIDDNGASKNDVWRSVDGGSTWTQVPISGTWWTPRRLPSSVVLPDGRIVLMGGGGGWDYENDVWVSADEGQHWSQVTANAAWSKRMGHTSLVLPDGSIVLMGGLYAIDYKNDVWRLGADGVDWLLTFLPLVIR